MPADAPFSESGAAPNLHSAAGQSTERTHYVLPAVYNHVQLRNVHGTSSLKDAAVDCRLHQNCHTFICTRLPRARKRGKKPERFPSRLSTLAHGSLLSFARIYPSHSCCAGPKEQWEIMEIPMHAATQNYSPKQLQTRSLPTTKNIYSADATISAPKMRHLSESVTSDVAASQR